MALTPTNIPGMIGGEGSSLLRGAKNLLPMADDAAALAARRRQAAQNPNDDPSLKEQAIDLLKGGVEEGDSLEPVDKVVNGIGTVAGVVGGVTFFNEIVGKGTKFITHGLAGFKNMPLKGALTKVGDVAGKPSEYFFDKDSSNYGFTSKQKVAELNKNLSHEEKIKPALGNDLFHATFVVESGVQTYNTVRSFSQKQKIRKTIAADMAEDRAKRGLSAPAGEVAVVDDAKKHNYIEHALRGAAAITGLVLNFKGMRSGRLSMTTMFVPMLAGMGIDMFMGEDALLNAYKPFSAAQKQGKAGQQDYAKFIFDISKEVNAHGKLGQAVAMQLAAHYKGINASAAHILNDMGTGEFKALTKKALADADAARHSAASDKHSHVDALHGKKKLHEPVGAKVHTGRLHDEAMKAIEQKAPTPGGPS